MFAHYAGTPHFLYPAHTIRDVPVARQKLHRFRAFVFDLHAIGPDELPVVRFGLLVQIDRFDLDADRARNG